MDTTFFGFGTNYAFDTRTDGRTAEQAMGRWVMGQWVKWVTFVDGSRGSWVGAG